MSSHGCPTSASGASVPRTSPRRRPLAGLVAVLTLVAAACGGGASDPGERVAEALQETFADEFAYRFVVEADRDALEGLGEDAGQAAAFLSGFAIEGVAADDGSSASVQALGTALLEMRSIRDEAVYLRLGVGDLLALVGGGGFAAEDVLPALEAMGVGQELQAAVLDALNGEWVGLEGGFDPADVGITDGEGLETEEARAAVEEAFGEDLPAFFERFVTVEGEPTDTQGGDTYDVSLRFRELLRATSTLGDDLGMSTDLSESNADLEADLAELPETVPGEITIEDGVVTAIAFPVADAVRSSGTELTGELALVLNLSQHGAVEPVTAPEGATVVSGEALQELVERFATSALTDGLGGTGLDG